MHGTVTKSCAVNPLPLDLNFDRGFGLVKTPFLTVANDGKVSNPKGKLEAPQFA